MPSPLRPTIPMRSPSPTPSVSDSKTTLVGYSRPSPSAPSRWAISRPARCAPPARAVGPYDAQVRQPAGEAVRQRVGFLGVCGEDGDGRPDPARILATPTCPILWKSSARSGRRFRAGNSRSLTMWGAMSARSALSSPRRRASVEAGLSGSGSGASASSVLAPPLPATHTLAPSRTVARSTPTPGMMSSASLSYSRKTSGVDSPTGLVTNTHECALAECSSVSSSPRPRPRATPPCRAKGTSDPRSAASRYRSSTPSPSPQSSLSARSVPAASADPPAIPPATGIALRTRGPLEPGGPWRREALRPPAGRGSPGRSSACPRRFPLSSGRVPPLRVRRSRRRGRGLRRPFPEGGIRRGGWLRLSKPD